MITMVRAANPGPMTLDGTNSYLVGQDHPVVVDPGPELPDHLDALASRGTPRLVLLTHHHDDHAASSRTVAQRWACPVRALDPVLCVGGPALTDGEVIAVDDRGVEVVVTPGHTADSVCLLVGDRLLTGDTVLGRGTTVIAEPDGDLGAYLASLDRLAEVIDARGVRALLPGHGPEITDPAARIAAYRRHRQERLDQVRAALDQGASTIDDVVAIVYADVDPAVLPAARQSVAAQLRYLQRSSPAVAPPPPERLSQ